MNSFSEDNSVHSFCFAAVGFACNFDRNYCSWTQDTTDDFNWPRQKGVASSGDLPGDHTSGSEYIYNEV